jgi:hypothetical protein
MLSLFLPYIPLILLHSSKATTSIAFGIPSYIRCLISLLGKIFGAPIVSLGVVHKHRVPSLGGFIRIHESIMVFIGCCSGMMFGGIHCIGWNFLFQSHTEQLLWRNACLAVLWSSASISICYGIDILKPKWRSLGSDLTNSFAIIIILTCCFAYIVARLILVVLICLGFRSLAPGMYDTVAWTKFIPHF